MSSTNGLPLWTRREAWCPLVWRGAALLPDRDGGADVSRGAVIRTILKDYAPSWAVAPRSSTSTCRFRPISCRAG
jgi:hypothetical protein